MGTVPDMATQLVPSIGAILLTMTSQGQQNALQKSRLFLSIAMILCNKMDLSFGANMAGFDERVTIYRTLITFLVAIIKYGNT